MISRNGSTYVGKTDDELFLVQWCDVKQADKIHSSIEYFAISRPRSGDAKGLFEYLLSAAQEFGITSLNIENCKMLVGIRTDGAFVNIAAVGLNRLVVGILDVVLSTKARNGIKGCSESDYI